MNEDTAMFLNAFPCNPRPFRTALAKHLESGGTMTGDKAKRILFTLVGIIRGQLFHIDLAANADLHNHHLARLPGRTHAAGVLAAMEREAEDCDTPTTCHQWWSSVASLIVFAYGEKGTYDSMEEWTRLHHQWKSNQPAAIAA
jgi:hypothetical protein